jgi:hypothetical protein
LRQAIFSCLGLGDGLISLVLAHNLSLNGCRTTVFHPFLSSLQSWFPSNKVADFSNFKEIENQLQSYDNFYVFYERSERMHALISYCKAHFQTLRILNPIATERCDYLFWEEGKFNGVYSFVDNLVTFCKNDLCLPKITKSNGITPPSYLQHRLYSKRVVIHPTSSKLEKNWPIDCYKLLARKLAQAGYEPVFILREEERDLYGVQAPLFSSLHDIASFIYESGYMIGNDSGIGHLASCLGLPTVTICRNMRTALFWRPSWTRGKVITPPKWIPNCKGMRFRDQFWHKWISVNQVLRVFFHLVSGE